MLRHLDLFSGIGGFALAARMVGGYETVAFCEIEPHCQGVLRRDWPDVRVFDDVRSLRADDVGPVDVITGGFPCQDISEAGKRVGIDGARSGLWRELHRLIGECRPAWALVENVPALRHRGYDRVHRDLEEIGYACRPFMVGADVLGFTQHRKRAWLLANADDARLQGAVRAWESHAPRQERPAACGESLRSACGHWPPGPRQVGAIPRDVDGVSDRAHRLRALGNAIVPQVAAIFLAAIRETHEQLVSPYPVVSIER